MEMGMHFGGYVTAMKVKDIRLKVIPSKIANDFVKKHHYSNSVSNTSQLHFGAYYNKVLRGVLSYGSPMDKSSSARCLPLSTTSLASRLAEIEGPP